MTTHSLFSPSSAHRWIPCPGSMVYVQGREGGSGSTFADDGTASHTLAAWALSNKKDCVDYPEPDIVVNGAAYPVDPERCDFVQRYVDYVRLLALGGTMFVEFRVDLSHILGEGQGGTADTVIILPEAETLITVDLKYGQGERVDASYLDEAGKRRPNQQLGLYAIGAIEDAKLLGHKIRKARLVVHQPRLNHVDEFEIAVDELMALAYDAAAAIRLAGDAMIASPEHPRRFLHPGEKQCRWCPAKAECPALAAKVAEEVRADFETIAAEGAVAPPPTDVKQLSRAAIALPLIEQWCSAIRSALHEAVSNKLEVIGSDGLPFKFVEGKQGSRKWADEAAAEAALCGQLADAAYAPRAIISASQAAKLLDKKATKNLWNDAFVPLITRSSGKPTLTLGSDPRPAYVGSAEAAEFEELGVPE